MLIQPYEEAMTCLEVRKRLPEFLDDAVSPQEEQKIRAHVERCDECRFVLRSARRTLRRYFGELSPVDSPSSR